MYSLIVIPCKSLGILTRNYNHACIAMTGKSAQGYEAEGLIALSTAASRETFTGLQQQFLGASQRASHNPRIIDRLEFAGADLASCSRHHRGPDYSSVFQLWA